MTIIGLVIAILVVMALPIAIRIIFEIIGGMFWLLIHLIAIGLVCYAQITRS
jgi:hypothetical protein